MKRQVSVCLVHPTAERVLTRLIFALHFHPFGFGLQIAGHVGTSSLRQLIFVFHPCKMCWHFIGCMLYALALLL